MLPLAIAAWVFLYPSLEAAESFALGWILQTWAVNMALMIAVAGGLHWYFYVRRGQGKVLKFDHRGQSRDNRIFRFSDQVRDNMFWSLTSGVAQLTAFQVVTMWLMANGYAPTITFASNPAWFVAFLILLPIWSAFHFYWAHRLLHVPFIFRHVHSLHHRNINIGPWSGLSMHPIEHFLYLTTLCLHWVVASHPIHLVFHVIYQGPGAAMTHTRYEALVIKDKAPVGTGHILSPSAPPPFRMQLRQSGNALGPVVWHVSRWQRGCHRHNPSAQKGYAPGRITMAGKFPRRPPQFRAACCATYRRFHTLRHRRHRQ